MSGHPVLVHYHIFKNAGTSVDFALERSFGSRWTSFEGRDAFDFLTSGQLGDFIQNHPEISAVSSHHARPPLPFPHCRPIVFLRHPLLRARSAYEFTRHHPEQPGCPPSQRKSFATFVEWSLAADITMGAGVIRDCQVSLLTDPTLHPDIRTGPAHARHLGAVQALLKSWGIFGIVERFKESTQRFQAKYGPEFPDLNFVDVRTNRTSNRIPDIEGETHEIKAELGPELFERLVEANKFDLALYGWAEEEFSSSQDRGRRSRAASKSDRLTRENEKLRDEVRYLTTEWEVLTARLRELTAQNKQLLNLRTNEIAEYEALAQAHRGLIAQNDELVRVRNEEVAQHDALARAHADLADQREALSRVRNEEVAQHEALAKAHNGLANQFATLVRVRDGEAAQHEALAGAHTDLVKEFGGLVRLRNDEVARHEALARAHADLAKEFEKLVRLRNDEVAKHEAVAQAHVDLAKEFEKLVRLRNDEVAKHEALAWAHADLAKEFGGLVRLRNDEVVQHECLALAHQDLAAQFDKLLLARSHEVAQDKPLTGAHTELAGRSEDTPSPAQRREPAL